MPVISGLSPFAFQNLEGGVKCAGGYLRSIQLRQMDRGNFDVLGSARIVWGYRFHPYRPGDDPACNAVQIDSVTDGLGPAVAVLDPINLLYAQVVIGRIDKEFGADVPETAGAQPDASGRSVVVGRQLQKIRCDVSQWPLNAFGPGILNEQRKWPARATSTCDTGFLKLDFTKPMSIRAFGPLSASRSACAAWPKRAARRRSCRPEWWIRDDSATQSRADGNPHGDCRRLAR